MKGIACYFIGAMGPMTCFTKFTNYGLTDWQFYAFIGALGWYGIFILIGREKVQGKHG